MVLSPRACASIVGSWLLLAAPAVAQQSDTVNPWGNAKTPDAPREAPAAPPPPAVPGNDTVNPWGNGAPPAAPEAPRGKGAKAPPPARAPVPARAPRRFVPAPRGKRHRMGHSSSGVPVATSPGFYRLDDGSTRVVLEVNRRVDISENRAQGRIVYRIRGTEVLQHNSGLPLLTGFISTPVDRVQLVQQGPDLDLVIELRQASEVAHRVMETPRGIVLQVDFPRVIGGERVEGTPEVGRERARRGAGSQRLGGSGAEAYSSEPK